MMDSKSATTTSSVNVKLHTVHLDVLREVGIDEVESLQYESKDLSSAVLKYLAFLNEYKQVEVNIVVSKRAKDRKVFQTRPTCLSLPCLPLKGGQHTHTYTVQYAGKKMEATLSTQECEGAVGTTGRFFVRGSLVLSVEAGLTLDEYNQFCNDAFEYAYPKDEKMDVYTQDLSTDSEMLWQKANSIAKRPMHTVYLPQKMKSRIVDDLHTFLSPTRKAWYRRNHLPYKKLYLFSGPSGSGKSTFAHALASEFNMNIAVLDSSSQMSNAFFSKCLFQLNKDTLLLIEGVERFFPNRKQAVRVEGLPFTLKGFLNALDGLARRSSLIVILTTTQYDKLDGALSKVGRVDDHLKFEETNKKQVEDMFRQMAPDHIAELPKFVAEVKLKSISVAMLQKFFIDKIGAASLVEELQYLYALRDTMFEVQREQQHNSMIE